MNNIKNITIEKEYGTKEHIKTLKESMFQAVSREQYELASTLRDDIKTLELRNNAL